jgi:hypothetical protein
MDRNVIYIHVEASVSEHLSVEGLYRIEAHVYLCGSFA